MWAGPPEHTSHLEPEGGGGRGFRVLVLGSPNIWPQCGCFFGVFEVSGGPEDGGGEAPGV